MKLFRSKFFLLCLAIALVLVLVPSILAALGQTDLLRAAVGTVSKPFVWCFSKASDAVNGFTAVFTEYDRLREENASLREELESLKNKDHDDQVLQNENAWLRDYLNIDNEMPDFAMKDARVISHASGNYATVFTLNKGRVHGVFRNLPVMTEQGLLGYISEVGLDYCKVVSLVETASSVGVYTDRMGVLGVVEGDPALRADGKCVMTNIPSTADIEVGDRIYTSGGSGSIYPTGLPVGTVLAIEADEQTRTLRAVIDPDVNFSDSDSIRRVMILCGYATEEAGQ